MTIAEYCNLLGWGQNELARQARINFRSAHKAIEGETISYRVAKKIAEAFSHALEKRILPGEIDGLSLRG